jgi:hypothetical protein
VKRLLLLLACAAAAVGCESYAQSKIDLADQARKGVRLARDAAERREQQLAAFDQRQREQLDAAFDADVARRPGLTADWVVAHRRAYAAALDALRSRRVEAERARLKSLENLDAVDAALAQIQRMQQAELKLTIPEVKP